MPSASDAHQEAVRPDPFPIEITRALEAKKLKPGDEVRGAGFNAHGSCDNSGIAHAPAPQGRQRAFASLAQARSRLRAQRGGGISPGYGTNQIPSLRRRPRAQQSGAREMKPSISGAREKKPSASEKAERVTARNLTSRR